VRRLWKPDISLNWQGAGSYISGVELHRREAAMAARNLELDLHYVRSSSSGPISALGREMTVTEKDTCQGFGGNIFAFRTRIIKISR